MAKRTLGAARSRNTFGIFKDHETDWLFKRTLEYISENAAELENAYIQPVKSTKEMLKAGSKNGQSLLEK